jgi:hypothetical protein
MRGLNATLALAAGATSHLVAAALGYESAATTLQSYADPAAVAGAQQRRTLTVLAGGRKGPDGDQRGAVEEPSEAVGGA